MPHLPEQVKTFVADLFDKKDKKHEGAHNDSGKKHGKTTPPPVPTKDELVNRFDRMNLEDQHGKHPNAEFLGGFKHGPANPNAGQASTSATPPAFPTPMNQAAAPATPSPPGPLPRPPQMFFPTPVHYQPSRTMQIALSDSSDPAWLELEPTPSASLMTAKPPKLPSRPHSEEQPRKNGLSASPLRPQVARPVSSPPISPKTSRTSSSGESTPEKKRGKGKANGGKSAQCNGFTKAGDRCKNKVKADPPLSVVDPDLPVERFCHIHRTEILTRNTGFNSRKTGEWVKYEDYIPSYLHPDTQVALRSEMEKPPSESDEPGFIYCFEIRDPDAPYFIQLKAGRTVTLQGRLNDWQKQCGSKEQVLRGWWPGNIANKDLQTSLLPGRIEAGEKGRHCHKLERLVHLELADLVVHTPYLDKGFPNVSRYEESEGARSNPGTPSKNGKRTNNGATALNILQQGNKPCPDCGSMHKEIFPFLRPDDGPYRSQEWEKLARPVIEKWGWFVETLA